MASVELEILVIFVLVMVNGLLAMSEMAVISSRRARLQERAEKGQAGARAALELAQTPGRFLSTVQAGITLVGILAGAFGGATLAGDLSARLQRLPILAPYSEALGLGLVVLIIGFLSLLLGELVPKRLALNNAEGIAAAMAPGLRWLSRLLLPLVHLLSHSTEAVLWVLRVKPSREPPVTGEEIQIMMEQGTRVGVFAPSQQDVVERLFRLGDQSISALMTPRSEVAWLDLDDSPEEIYRKITSSRYSCFPVARGNLDQVLGLVQTRDLLARTLAGQPADLRAAMGPPLFVPDSMPALKVLDRFKEHQLPVALVVDEYGEFEGLVALGDVVEAILGEVGLVGQESEPEVVQREDGSWLMDGMVSVEELRDRLRLTALPEEDKLYYQTLGGLVMHVLGRIPVAGDHFERAGWRYEVMDMDSRRVDKVLISATGPASTANPEEPGSAG
jgi:putative hemolysin